MSKIIFHCGAHKTGTTAFQLWLKENRAALHLAGFTLPKMGASLLGNYVALARALTGHSIDIHRQEALLQSLRDDSGTNPAHDMIVSAEFLSSDISVGDDGGVSTYKILSRHLDELGRKKIAVLVVRDQGSWMNSAYAQRRKMLLEVPSFEEFVQRRIERGHGNWLLQGDAFRRNGFEFYGLPYSMEFMNRGVVQGVLSLPLFESLRRFATDCVPERANDSLSAQGLILADVVRARVLEHSPRLKQPVRRHLSQLIIRHAERRLPSSRFNGLTVELSDRIFDAYSASNREFAERFLGHEWEELFPSPSRAFEISPRTLNDLSRKEALVIDELASKITKQAQSKGLI